MGPEWWWQRDLRAQLDAELLDAVNRSTAASALTALALGAKGHVVQKAIASTPKWPRPYTPPPQPAPKRSLAEKARALLTQLGR